MKIRFLIIILLGIVSIIPSGFSLCIADDDWSEAPCLDMIMNGKYNQEDVDRWSDYYSYKGSEKMEAKYLELKDAIKENRVEEWNRESNENLNVYQYYFFSGRVANTGEYHGYFDTIKINEPVENNKQTYPNLQPIFSSGIILIIEELIISVIVGSVIIGVIIWRKRK